MPAGWLIDKLGLKGKRIGGAMISETSANYIINTGYARSSDVIELSRFVKDRVRKEFNVDMQEEVQIVL